MVWGSNGLMNRGLFPQPMQVELCRIVLTKSCLAFFSSLFESPNLQWVSRRTINNTEYFKYALDWASRSSINDAKGFNIRTLNLYLLIIHVKVSAMLLLKLIDYNQMKNKNDVQILMDLPRNISNFNPNIPPHSGTQVFM